MTREEAIEIVQAIKFIDDFEDYSDRLEIALDMAIEALKDRPHGEWEWKAPTQDTIRAPHCSYCGHMNEFLLETNFCPNCGASMVQKEGEEKKSCLNCGTSECELGNRARYGFCGNWTMREGDTE